MSGHSLIALITVPFFTGAIGYLTNWTGVLMLFYPVHFRGLRVETLRKIVRVFPRKVRQVPGLMVGGIGWQGIVPSRAAKMGSLAVDVGIAKLGTPSEFWDQLEPKKMAQQIVDVTRGDMRETVDRIMNREHPRLWARRPAPGARGRLRQGARAAPRDRPGADRPDRLEPRPAARHQADGHQALRRSSPTWPTACSSTWAGAS